MLRPILLSIACAGFAFAAAASGLDRLALQSPEMARTIPDPFRARADRSAAALALDAQEAGEALEAATAAVKSDPADSDATALLAAARLLDGDLEGGDESMRVAARFGWRNPAVQLYWYEAALLAENYEVAMSRADAILRINPRHDKKDALLAPIEENPEGRKVLIRHLAKEPNWLSGYFDAGRNQAEETVMRRSLVAIELGERDKWLRCEYLGNFTRNLLARGSRNLAERVWNANCPDRQVTKGLADPNFDYLNSADPFPFGWRVRRTGNLSIRLEGADESQAVAMKNNGSALASVLVQATALRPGSYRLRATASIAGKSAEGQLLASIGCGGVAPYPDEMDGELVSQDGQLLVVESCPDQRLALWLRPGADYVQLDSVELEALN